MFRCFVHQCAEEINKRCRQIIVDHHDWLGRVTGNAHPLPCVFGNLEDCLPPKTYRRGDHFAFKLRDVSRSKLMGKQWCFVHEDWCPLFGPEVESEFDTSGLPCWDFSLAGKSRQEQGETNTVFMSHAKIHKERRTPLLLLENVKAIVWEINEERISNVLFPQDSHFHIN